MVSSTIRRKRIPGLSLHKANGQGVVRLTGKDVYCGPFDTPECRAWYLRALADWEAAGRRPAAGPADPEPGVPSDITVNEFLVAYRVHADGYYVKNGRPTSEVGNIQLAIRPLRRLSVGSDDARKDSGHAHTAGGSDPGGT